MHCPKCGQSQISEETRFCSRCGFLLSGVAEVFANNGLVPAQQTGFAGRPDSQRRRGIKQGAFLFLSTFLVVPLLIMIAVAFNTEPFLALAALFLLGVGGILRTVYALMFESGAGTAPGLPSTSSLPSGDARGSLPPAYSVPASAYTTPTAGSWRDTNDLQPDSVTDGTTRLLQKEEDR